MRNSKLLTVALGTMLSWQASASVSGGNLRPQCRSQHDELLSNFSVRICDLWAVDEEGWSKTNVTGYKVMQPEVQESDLVEESLTKGLEVSAPTGEAGQFLSQCLLALSLSLSLVFIEHTKDGQQLFGIQEFNVSLLLAILVVAFGCDVLSTALYMGLPSLHIATWCVALACVMLNLSGIHMMWTWTWLIGAGLAFLLGSETGLAVAAVVGLCSVTVVWYLFRIIFRHGRFPDRAMRGWSYLITHTVLGMNHENGIYIDEIAPVTTQLAFHCADIPMHMIVSLMLLQHSAQHITPACVLSSFVLTVFWIGMVSHHHMVIDWSALWKGRLRYVRFSKSSYWEPAAIAQIYGFENPLIPEDDAFTKAAPILVIIAIISHIVMLLVTMLPNASAMFYFCGGGGLFSVQGMAIASIVSLTCSGCCIIYGFGLCLLEKYKRDIVSIVNFTCSGCCIIYGLGLCLLLRCQQDLQGKAEVDVQVFGQFPAGRPTTDVPAHEMSAEDMVDIIKPITDLPGPEMARVHDVDVSLNCLSGLCGATLQVAC